jgi:hypothetical protein
MFYFTFLCFNFRITYNKKHAIKSCGTIWAEEIRSERNIQRKRFLTSSIVIPSVTSLPIQCNADFHEENKVKLTVHNSLMVG